MTTELPIPREAVTVAQQAITRPGLGHIEWPATVAEEALAAAAPILHQAWQTSQSEQDGMR